MTDARDDRKTDDDLPPAPPVRGTDQAVWVGLFLIFGLLAALVALLVLTDAAIFRGRYVVHTTVPNAGGIRRGDPVQMRGVNIGRVQRFLIQHESVTIHLEIEGEYKVPKDSRVELKSAGLLGGLVADIVPGKASETLRYGDSLPGSSEEQLLEATNRIATQVETVLGRMDTLLAPETIENVHGSARDLQKVLKELSSTVEEQRRQIADLTSSLKRSSQGLERATTGPELERTVKRFDALSERLDRVSTSLDRSSQSLESVMGRVDRGEGTLGRLSKDAALYDNMNTAVQNLDRATQDIRKLTEDVRKNPKKYLKISVF
jgi:phospholipid/cholesterol/gamma-HCH transport system substrate-binding protein